nr:MAG TPA: hypothetical protein [Caudoviricetes sp.]
MSLFSWIVSMIFQSLFQYFILKFSNHIFTSLLLGVYHKKGVNV